MRRRRLIGAAVAVVVAVVATVLLTRGADADPFHTEAMSVASGQGADAVILEATLFLPDAATSDDPAPAVMLAHGFGGSQASSRADAQYLAGQGYVVLIWSARGFGRSTGLIGLDSPDFEVADASTLIDLLADRPEVQQDAAGDPRVGIAGPSYGGALALLTAGYDDRVDAVVPQITWNSLASAFLPDAAGTSRAATPAAGPDPTGRGVFKRQWAGLFFGSAAAGGPAGGPAAVQDLACGRFRPEICAVYTQAATTGSIDEVGRALLQRSSPASVLDRIAAPTLLIQGQSDTLFPLAEADANARGIAAAGTPVAVAWYGGGHDAQAGSRDTDRLRQLSLDWFDRYLREASTEVPAFQFVQVTGLSTSDGDATSQVFQAASYPGLDGGRTERSTLALSGDPQPVVSPPGGSPASLSSLPGLGVLGTLVPGLAVDPAGQAAMFPGEPLSDPVTVVGSPRITLRVGSSTGTATVFVKLYDVDPDGTPSLPQGLVAPIRLTGLSPTPDTVVAVTLPGIAHRFETGHRLAVAVASTDQGYQPGVEPAVYTVALDGGTISLPTVEASGTDAGGPPWVPFLGGLAVLAALLAIVVVLTGRRGRRQGADDDVPLVVGNLSKAYADGFVAVRELSFRVEQGQVVGLLGPNGAGKTTTLRMLMGLILPTTGGLKVFGHDVHPGAPVLSRLGAFVEGTGFLPHLSGRANLELYWAATGRPAADAHLDEALAIAGLGNALKRRVRTYSQGMRQRLAIAQAMLGLPDLLVLDEPTNGLDPPQIREMRKVLRAYAAPGTGRTVLVSSHQLAEVEQTCTHVVVMNRGRLVATGTVADVVGASSSLLVEVDDAARAVDLLNDRPGVAAAVATDDGVSVELAGAQPADVVDALVGAGLRVQRISPRRRLEDVFLSLVEEDARA